LYGSKPQPEYTIKLNNEFIEKEKEGVSAKETSPRSNQSQVVTGKTIRLT
jgi:hypothetical protein